MSHDTTPAAARAALSSRAAHLRQGCKAGAVLIALAASAPALAAGAPGAPFMRFANASDTQIAFVARGELWTTKLAGGPAARLTHDQGSITYPRFSPDGRWIAFTARRAGTFDIYVLPSSGGTERRLTFAASGAVDDARVVTWTPDSRRIVFLSSSRSPSTKIERAYTVPLEGGYPETLPLDHSGLLSFGPHGHVIAYERIFRDALPKRYIGGRHPNIYTYDFGSRQLTRITDWKGTDTAPMWFGHTIYFLSDRGAGFRANIWAYDTAAKSTRQITHFGDFDVDTPSLGSHTITFQQGGRLFALDLPSEALRQLAVDVPDDGARTAPRVQAAGKPRATDAMGAVDYAISPDGAELALSAQGDLFALRADRTWRNITGTPGTDEDHPSWSPDGSQIAYETDAAGEQQIAVRPSAGGQERVLTQFPAGVLYTPLWSPDGTQMLVANAAHELWLVPATGGPSRKIAQDPQAEIRDARFSPDGKFAAYSTMRTNRMRAVHLQALDGGQDTVVSSPFESDRMPRFSANGRVLFFVSQRYEQPLVSDRDEESIVATLNSDGIYAAPLDPADPSPLAPAAAHAQAAPHTDLQGLMARAVALPIDPAVIASLELRGDRLFYEAQPPQLIDGDLAGQDTQLHVYDLAAGSDQVIVRGLADHSLAANGGAAAFRQNGGWHIASTDPKAKADATLDTAALRAAFDPRAAWAEMLHNAWRLDRDLFFSRVMNGTDWPAVRDAYAALLAHVASDDDFLYVLGQMQGEMASSHTFLEEGRAFDTRPPVSTGLLGADYVLDAASGRYRIVHILDGDNSRAEFRSPLRAPGLDVHDGDYLLAINGHEVTATQGPDAWLAGSAAKASISVAASPDGKRRTLSVTPLQDEVALRRYDWMTRNRNRVDRLSGGRIGYVALSDFVGEGWGEFVRQFYPQADKDGLVIDVRWNHGGFTSQAVLDVLRRTLAGVFINRERAVSTLPVAVPPRTMVTLLNWGSGSDGDQFPYYFRQYGLGPLVGTRSWGGVQGINQPWSLMDGTALTIPKDALADPAGQWIIENTGVAPDIVVDDRPEEAVTGRDIQLETAVSVALRRLADHPPTRPVAAPELPAYPAAGEVPGASFAASPH